MGPSSMIADLRFPKKCVACRDATATQKWGKGWEPGTDLCSRCWRMEVAPTLGVERDYYDEDTEC